jgi:hypothetical protein
VFGRLALGSGRVYGDEWEQPIRLYWTVKKLFGQVGTKPMRPVCWKEGKCNTYTTTSRLGNGLDSLPVDEDYDDVCEGCPLTQVLMRGDEHEMRWRRKRLT